MHHLFNPFEELKFGNDICFLTGKVLDNDEQYFIKAFPEWLMERYHISENRISMLDDSQMKYNEIVLPASKEVADAISKFDSRTQKAFETGYEGIKNLSDLTLFQWIARVFYGVLYQEIFIEIKDHEKRGIKMQFSDNMLNKFKNLLFMMQSFIRPIEFKGFSPWSLLRYPVRVSKDILNYKDETRNFNFSINMNGFGIICCLQDNGEIAEYYKDTLNKIKKDTVLHPAQFEEIYGKFLYANYLSLPREPYTITEEGDKIIFELPKNRQKPKYKAWNEKIYGQVLTNIWKPWGIEMKQVYNPPNSTLSYLIDERTNEFIKFEDVDLEY